MDAFWKCITSYKYNPQFFTFCSLTFEHQSHLGCLMKVWYQNFNMVYFYVLDNPFGDLLTCRILTVEFWILLKIWYNFFNVFFNCWKLRKKNIGQNKIIEILRNVKNSTCQTLTHQLIIRLIISDPKMTSAPFIIRNTFTFLSTGIDMNFYKLLILLFAILAMATNGVESGCKRRWGVHGIKQPYH